MVVTAALMLLILATGEPDPIVLSWRDAGAVGATALLYVSAPYLDARNGTPDCPCDPRSVPEFDRWPIGRRDGGASNASDWLRWGLTIGGPLALATSDSGTPVDRALAGALIVESTLAASGASEFLKSAVNRPRPRAYDGDVGGDPYRSFPSGHTTSSFAAAASVVTVYAHRHPRSPGTKWLAVGAFGTAGTVAYLRVAAGSHFPSDVVAGAALGTAVGWLVADMHFHHLPGNVSVSFGPRFLSLTKEF